MTGLKLPWPRDPRYKVTEDGDIYGPRGHKLAPIVQRGRAGISVYRKRQWQRVAVSVIVCETFHGPRPDGMHAAHENGNALDNRAANLSWKTPRENELDKRRHGTALQGERHPQAKLTEADVAEIRTLRSTFGQPLQTIATSYGVTPTTISYIVNRKTWGHL